MNSITIRLFFTFLFVASAALLILSGCTKKKEAATKQPTITLENLQTAYGIALKRATWYHQYAETAKKDRRANISFLFKAVARSEEIHAKLHADLLRSRGIEPRPLQIDSAVVGTITQSLKMAINCETLEYESMYPNLARTAEIEGFTEAAEQFKRVKDADAIHGKLFKNAELAGGNVPKVIYRICPGCGTIFTEDTVTACPACKIAKDKFEAIS